MCNSNLVERTAEQSASFSEGWDVGLNPLPDPQFANKRVLQAVGQWLVWRSIIFLRRSVDEDQGAIYLLSRRTLSFWLGASIEIISTGKWKSWEWFWECFGLSHLPSRERNMYPMDWLYFDWEHGLTQQIHFDPVCNVECIQTLLYPKWEPAYPFLRHMQQSGRSDQHLQYVQWPGDHRRQLKLGITPENGHFQGCSSVVDRYQVGLLVD